MAAGIIFGLLAAIFQSFGFLFSRHFLTRNGTALELLVISQSLIGIVSLIVLVVLWPWEYFNWHFLVAQIAGAVVFIIGNVSFFMALKEIESSRIASLMGLKILLVPLFLLLFFNRSFGVAQMAGLLLAAPAALLINYRKTGAFHWNGMGWVASAIFFYAWGDVCGGLMTEYLPFEDKFYSGVVAVLTNNVFIMLMILPGWLNKKINKSAVLGAMPYAALWGTGQVCLYCSFGFVGASFGAVLQAARGPMLAFLGVLLAKKGLEHLEKDMSGAMWARRIIAALLMFAAIALYSIGAK